MGALVWGSSAWANIGGRVWIDNNCNGIFDAGDVLMPGVTVKLFNCDAGVFVGTTVTDQNGAFIFDNFGPPDNYKVCVTLPPGFSFAPQVIHQPPPDDCCDSSVGPDGCTDCFFWNNNIDLGHNAGLCQTPPPPPCPVCVDPQLGLGAAAGCTVLELGAAQVSITGPPGGLLGNICIAPGGKLSMSGSEYIAGLVELGTGATFQNSSSGIVGGVVQNVDLSSQIAAAYAAANADAALPCTQVFATLDGKSVKTITGVSGVNVICVQNVVLSGTQILLTGPADAKFIFNVSGKFVFTGGGLGPQIRVDASAGIKPSAVVYNILGAGQDVAFSGGGGGVNCCAAIVDGTLLAPYRKIALSPGLVNGEVISGMDISIVSGSSVRCPPPCPH